MTKKHIRSLVLAVAMLFVTAFSTGMAPADDRIELQVMD